jgi:hypothetical protein
MNNEELTSIICGKYLHKLSIRQIAKEVNSTRFIVSKILKTTGTFEKLKSLENNGYNYCKGCKEWLPISKFHKCNSGNGFRCYCAKCRKQREPYNPEYFLIWRKNNLERKTQSDRIWRNNNRERIKLHKKSPEYKIIKRKSDANYYQKIKSENNSLFEARKLRSMLSESIRKNRDNLMSKFGYSLSELKSHLQSLFDNKMSWDNYGRGGWNIDHIKPLIYFDLTDPEIVKEAFKLSNIQPLYESDNSSKGTLYEGKRLLKKHIV